MKVKELINILSKLDQEKEIKIIIAHGYECEEETSEEIEIKEYKDLWIKNQCGIENDKLGRGFYEVDDDSNNKDFYIIV